MAQSDLNVLHRDCTTAEEQAGASMPEIMKPNFPQTVFFNDPREVFRHIVGAQEFTALVNADVVEVVSIVRFLEEAPIHFLLFLFL